MLESKRIRRAKPQRVLYKYKQTCPRDLQEGLRVQLLLGRSEARLRARRGAVMQAAFDAQAALQAAQQAGLPQHAALRQIARFDPLRMQCSQ